MSFFGCRDVAIADNRNMDAWIVLHLTYQSPIGLSRIHLTSCSSVYGERLNAAVLQLFSQFGNHKVVTVPSQAGLHRHGHIDSLHHVTRNIEQQRYVSQHTSSSSLSSHLLHRTSKVDVYHIGLRLFHNLGSLHHVFCRSAINLNTNRTFLVADGQLVDSRLDRAHQSLSRYKLRIHHSRSVSLAEHTEAYIGHVFHRSEEERLVSKFYISYFHIS